MSRSCIRAQIVIVTRLQQGSSLCNMLLRGMKDDSGKANEQDTDVFHHDEGRKLQDDFSVDVRNLVDALRSRGNPFLEAGVDLVNLDGRISNANDVAAIYDKGKDQYDQFVNDVIVTRNTRLDSPIKNNAFQLFKITKRRKAQQPNLPLLKAGISLFGQLYIATTEHHGDNCDLDMFFALEAHSFPLRWRMEMRRCIIRQNLTSSTATRGKQKLYRMVQRKQTPSSSTIAWFKTAANLFTSWMLEERELSSSSRRDYS